MSPSSSYHARFAGPMHFMPEGPGDDHESSVWLPGAQGMQVLRAAPARGGAQAWREEEDEDQAEENARLRQARAFQAEQPQPQPQKQQAPPPPPPPQAGQGAPLQSERRPSSQQRREAPAGEPVLQFPGVPRPDPSPPLREFPSARRLPQSRLSQYARGTQPGSLTEELRPLTEDAALKELDPQARSEAGIIRLRDEPPSPADPADLAAAPQAAPASQQPPGSPADGPALHEPAPRVEEEAEELDPPAQWQAHAGGEPAVAGGLVASPHDAPPQAGAAPLSLAGHAEALRPRPPGLPKSQAELDQEDVHDWIKDSTLTPQQRRDKTWQRLRASRAADDHTSWTEDVTNKERNKLVRQAAAELGMDEKKLRRMLETERLLDWSKPASPLDDEIQNRWLYPALTGLGLIGKVDTTRLLPDGTLVPNPAVLGDREAFDEAINASHATPKEKERVRALWPRLHLSWLAQIRPTLETMETLPGVESYMEWRMRQTNVGDKSEEQIVDDYLQEQKKRGWPRKLADNISSNLMAGAHDLVTGLAGSVAFITGSQMMAEYAVEKSAEARRLTGALEHTGNGGFVNTVVGGIARAVPGLIAGAATGGMAGIVQGVGGTYADVYAEHLRQGLTHEQADAAATRAAVISGVISAVASKIPGGKLAAGGKVTAQAVRAEMQGAMQAVMNAAAKKGVTIAKGAVEEAGQELLEGALQHINSELAKGSTLEQAAQSYLEQLPENLATAGALGGGQSGMHGGGGSGATPPGGADTRQPIPDSTTPGPGQPGLPGANPPPQSPGGTPGGAGAQPGTPGQRLGDALSQQPGGLANAIADAKRLWQDKGGGVAGGDKTQVFHSAEELINSDYARAHPFTDAQKEALRSAEGFYDPRTGQTVLIAGNVALRPGETPQAALTRVMLHERVGHDGLNAMLSGPPLPNGKPSLIQQRWANLQKRMPQAELDAIAAEPGYAHLKGDTEALALEWFARQAEAHPELLNKPSLVSVMWGNFKESVVDLMTRMGLEPPQGKDLDTQVMALLQRARQSAVKGGSGANAGNGTLGQDLQFSMGGGQGTPAQGGDGTSIPGADSSSPQAGDTKITPLPTGASMSPDSVPSLGDSRRLITEMNNLASQRPLTGSEWADHKRAQQVVAEDTVQRLEKQAEPLSEMQQQELAEARKALTSMANAKGPPHLTGTTKESADYKSYHYLLNPAHPEGQHKAKWFDQALGFNQNNWSDLARQVIFDPSTAIPTITTTHGQKFEQPIILRGANGKIIRVIFVWIRNADGVERLVTSLPTNKKDD